MAEHKSSFKEMLTSITIAFILAFVFRAFVIEAFVIPTGSMAPTLMGAHVRVHSPLSGYEFPVGPAEYGPGQRPERLQSGRVEDLMLGPGPAAEIAFEDRPIRAGDRILVLKYLLGLFDPARFDVVVFKSPVDPQTNFIKRLIGLPGEEIALIDGDVFVRDAALPTDPELNPWAQPGWTIARKGERVQRAVWQDVFDSYYTPREVTVDARTIFRPPWIGGQGWDLTSATYRYEGEGTTNLAWDHEGWPLRDRYAYDESTPGLRRRDDRFPVADLRMTMGFEPDQEPRRLAAVITARGHEFRAQIAGGEATLAMRELGEQGEWTVLDAVPLTIEPGRVTNIEFWHVDQRLELWVDGDRVAQGVYEWTPLQRVYFSTGETLADLLETGRSSVFADSSTYLPVTVRWEMEGTPATLHRTGLQRDLYYQASVYDSPPGGPRHVRHAEPSAGSHPDQPLVLTDRQYFAAGDNSPHSSDGRLWDAPDPWVARMDETVGVVARELMIGRAFFVYFPSPLQGRFGIPIPDAGRLRLIW